MGELTQIQIACDTDIYRNLLAWQTQSGLDMTDWCPEMQSIDEVRYQLHGQRSHVCMAWVPQQQHELHDSQILPALRLFWR